MGLFDVFKKKECSICGGEIGLLGNRKLADGNMCKHCAAKLSPWFEDRRESSIEEIHEQLRYREQNKEAVAAFHATDSYGKIKKLLMDEDARKFCVAEERDLSDNPDILDYSQLLGCEIDIDERRNEEKTKDKEGHLVSYRPPRYKYYYDFFVKLRVEHPYFDEMKFKLNPYSIETTHGQAVPEFRKPDPGLNMEYHECEEMARDIKAAVLRARQAQRVAAREEAKPKAVVTCPNCGATTTPDAKGCCEYCGGSVKG